MAVTLDNSTPLISCPECGCGSEYIRTIGEEFAKRILYRTFCTNCFWTTGFCNKVFEAEKDWNEQIFTAFSGRPLYKYPNLDTSVIDRIDALRWGVLAALEVD